MGINYSRIIDITQPVYHECPGNPAFPPMQVKREMRAEEIGWNAERLEISTHIGTHIDSPWHRKNGVRTIDQMPPDAFIGPATAIDLFHKKADEGIFPADLLPYESDLKPIVLLCTGWGEKRAHTDEYMLHSPWLSAEGAEWLVAKGIKGVGIDHFSIGGANPDNVCAPHDDLLDGGVWILEELLLPKEILTFENLHVIALPLLVKGASGAPTRAVALDCT